MNVLAEDTTIGLGVLNEESMLPHWLFASTLESSQSSRIVLLTVRNLRKYEEQRDQGIQGKNNGVNKDLL